jgi:hypothetical protein
MAQNQDIFQGRFKKKEKRTRLSMLLLTSHYDFSILKYS